MYTRLVLSSAAPEEQIALADDPLDILALLHYEHNPVRENHMSTAILSVTAYRSQQKLVVDHVQVSKENLWE